MKKSSNVLNRGYEIYKFLIELILAAIAFCFLIPLIIVAIVFAVFNGMGENWRFIMFCILFLLFLMCIFC